MTSRGRLALPPRWALLAVLGVPLLVLVVFGTGYFKIMHYRRVASQHIPQGAYFAARVDLEQVVLFEPFRKHLLPALEGQSSGGTTGGRLQRLERAMDINAALDTREIVVALGPDPTSWTLVIGGRFRPDTFVQALQDTLTKESGLSLRVRGQVLAISPWNLFLAQAADGSLLIANAEAPLGSALVSNDNARVLGLPTDGAGGFALRASSTPLQVIAGDLAALQGTLTLGSRVMARLTSTLAPGVAPSRARQSMEAFLSALRALFLTLDGPGTGSLRAVLARAEVSQANNGEVFLESHWEQPEIERAAQEWAAVIARTLR